MIDLHSPPTAGFDSPLEMLHACHGRIKHHCELVARITAHVAAHGADDEAREAAGTVLRFFEIAGRDHHLDEEEDLFPALLACVAPEARSSVQTLISRLRDEHIRLDALWTEVKARLQALREGREQRLPPGLTAEFARAYQGHISEEEGLLIPLARHVLPAAEIQRLGRAMAARRGPRAY